METSFILVIFSSLFGPSIAGICAVKNDVGDYELVTGVTCDFVVSSIFPHLFCDWSLWGAWSTCNSTCSPLAWQTRTRECIKDSCSVGKCLGSDTEEQKCPLPCCKGYPQWVQWSRWFCTIVFNAKKGTANRYRKCDSCHEQTCRRGHYRESITCWNKCTGWQNWGSWGRCSSGCGRGLQKRRRGYKEGATSQFCVGSNRQTRVCYTGYHPTYGSWGDWSECSANSRGGQGEIVRRRTCTKSRCPISQKDCIQSMMIETRVCFAFRPEKK